MGVLDWLSDLWGKLNTPLFRGAEHERLSAVYASAVERREEAFEKLKQSVQNLVEMRDKAAADLSAREAELREVMEHLGQDRVELAAVRRRDELKTEIAQLSVDLEALTAHAEAGELSLERYREQVKKLEEEQRLLLPKWRQQPK